MILILMEAVIMEALEQSVNKFLFLFFVVSSCGSPEYQWIPYNEKGLDLTKRYVQLNREVYTGYVLKLGANQKDTLSISFYNKGLKDGVWNKFYNNGSLKEVRVFKNGKKTGQYFGYYMSGEIAFEYNFKDGEYHGKRYEWKKDGSLLRESNYKNGYEKGFQKIWWADGRIKSNYVIKNNRRYGLLGIKNCVNVSDSIFTN